MRYKIWKDGEAHYPVMNGYLQKCCECGDVHKLGFKVVKVTKVNDDGTWEFKEMNSKKYRIEVTAYRKQVGNMTEKKMREKIKWLLTKDIPPGEMTDQILNLKTGFWEGFKQFTLKEFLIRFDGVKEG